MKFFDKKIMSFFILFSIVLSLFSCSQQTSTDVTSEPPEESTITEQTRIPITEQITDIITDIVTEPPEPTLDIVNIGLKYPNGKEVPDTEFSISQDSISVYIPFETDESKLEDVTPYADDGIEILSFTDRSGKETGTVSLNDTLLISLTDGIIEKTYTFSVHRQVKDIPIVSLYTDSGDDITSKFDYVHGYLSIDTGDIEQYRGQSRQALPLNVRGRGNASWWQSDKKSYRIKLDEKASVLGLEANRDWVLVPNYYDKTLIRNAVAHKMAQQMEYLYYTPTHIMVDLFLNGKYRGVYSICDKIEVTEEKIVIGETTGVSDPGFLIEIGWDFEEKHVYGKDYFDTDLLYRLFVKEPVIDKRYNSEMNYIIDYISKTEKAIVSGGDWEKYIDLDAFVDWFIIAELTNNTEMAFYRSCYFYKPQGGKLIMGPVWDFDMAFGNHKGDVKNYDAWATGEATYHEIGTNWATYLIKDERFMSAVKKRWEEKRDILVKTAMEAIDEYSTQANASQAENFKLWNIMNKQVGIGRVDYKKYNTYSLQVQYLREFITARAAWIDSELDIK